jgi:hypothetical protein
MAWSRSVASRSAGVGSGSTNSSSSAFRAEWSLRRSVVRMSGLRRLSAIGIGYRLKAIGYRLKAIGYRLSAEGYRLSAIGYQLTANG